MAIPASREELKQYCLRALGSPVININVDNSQLEDRIDEALQIYQEKHYDGTENQWLYYELTQTDIDNQYITLPDNILVVISVMPLNVFVSRDAMFSYQYQLALSELSPWRPLDKIDYFMKLQDFENTLSMVAVENSFEFTRHNKKLKMYVDLNQYVVGYKVCMNAQVLLDPNTATEIYNDNWLKRYTTALFKLQWGSNLKKMDGIALLGGVPINGQQLFDEAQNDIKDLNDELDNVYTLPNSFIM